MRYAALLVGILACAPALADSTNNFAFRRMTDPVIVQVGTTAQATVVPTASMTDGNGVPFSSFHVANPNNVWVRLKGFSNLADCQNVGVTPTTGWLWPPGFVAVYATQQPFCVSAMAVSEPGYPVTGSTALVPLEISYGNGQ